MKCPLFRFQKDDILDKLADRFVNQCPTIIGPASKEYCCYDGNLEAHCCDAGEFFVNM